MGEAILHRVIHLQVANQGFSPELTTALTQTNQLRITSVLDPSMAGLVISVMVVHTTFDLLLVGLSSNVKDQNKRSHHILNLILPQFSQVIRLTL